MREDEASAAASDHSREVFVTQERHVVDRVRSRIEADGGNLHARGVDRDARPALHGIPDDR